MGVAKGSAPGEAGSFWTYRRSPWSGRRDYCACRASPAVDAAGEGCATGRGGGDGRPGFGGCPAAWDLEEPCLLYNWRSAWKATALVARGAAPSSAGFIQLGVVTDPSYERAAIRMASGAALAGSRGTGLTLAERAGVMEIDLPQGVRVRVDGGVDELALRRVLSAVRGLR